MTTVWTVLLTLIALVPFNEAKLWRPCNSDDITPKLNQIEIKADYSYTAEVWQIGGVKKANITARVQWNFTDPSNVSLDGFAIHFRPGAASELLPSFYPKNICDASQGLAWIRNPDSSSMCSNVSTLCSNSSLREDCFCSKNCSVFPQNCRNVENDLVDQRGFFTVPPDVNYLEFDAELRKIYTLLIIPYHRQYYGNFHTFAIENWVELLPIIDCAVFLRDNTMLSSLEAEQACCDMNVLQVIPRRFTFGAPTIDFENEVVQVTLTMLPPIDDQNLSFISIVPQGPAYHTVKSVWTRVNSTGDRSDRAKCDQTTYFYQFTLTGVTPKSQLALIASSQYEPGSPMEIEARCQEFFCATNIYLDIPGKRTTAVMGGGLLTHKTRFRLEYNKSSSPSDIRACDPQFKLCVENAACSNKDDEFLFNATCTCNQGLKGNGMRNTTKTLGTGCTDIDYCVPDENPCVNGSICVDNAAPLLGAQCICTEHFFGDGYINGTGCTYRSNNIVQIVVPAVVVVLLVCAVIYLRLRLAKARKDDLKWSHFVANTALQYAIPPTDEKSDICLPTFGEKWEIDRIRLRLGDVLGRGNDGIVYRGWYNETDNPDKNVNEEIPVAIKSTKEGLAQEYRLGEFLAEIGFILNVGEHPNVLKILGCCTTQKPILMVTEFMKYGDLLHYLWDARVPTKCFEDPAYYVTEKTLCQMARQVAEGMEFLTRSRIIHGDIAARNVLVGEDLVCKLSDFGLANDVYRYGVIRGQAERSVPLKWVSPERMMSGKVPITSRSDVWSFGNLMYEMVTLGCMPHSEVDSAELLFKLKSGYRMKQPSSCSDHTWAIMTKCWKWKASSRPTFTELVTLLTEVVKQDVIPTDVLVEIDQMDDEEYKIELNHTYKNMAFHEDDCVDTKGNGYKI